MTHRLNSDGGLSRWRALPNTTATVYGSSFGIPIPPGSFAPRVRDGVRRPGVTGMLEIVETESEIRLVGVRGNIWTDTAWVPHPWLLGSLDKPDLLHFSAFPRIHFCAAAAEIVALGENCFRLRAFMDVKSRRSIPVDFHMQLERSDGTLHFQVRSLTSAADGGLAKGCVSRRRLNLGGLSSFVDDGISISVAGQAVPVRAEDDAEPGPLAETDALASSQSS